MAQPRVFVSSTYYDLKYVRSSLELFIESLGYEPVLFEHGEVTFSPDQPLDVSCYREVENCDIYVLIIGGRYGSEASQSKPDKQRDALEHYESITKSEYKTAVRKDIPIYILIDRNVYAEYFTFQINEDNTNVKYAHVQSTNVFHFIREILSESRNNPVQSFDKPAEIEEWLRIQWAGLFRDMLSKRSNQKQLTSLEAQVSELGELNKTLQKYMEEVVTKVNPEKSADIIKVEHARLADAVLEHRLMITTIGRSLLKHGVDMSVIEKIAHTAKTPLEFMSSMNTHLTGTGTSFFYLDDIELTRQVNEVLCAFDLPPFPVGDQKFLGYTARRGLRQRTVSTSDDVKKDGE